MCLGCNERRQNTAKLNSNDKYPLFYLKIILKVTINHQLSGFWWSFAVFSVCIFLVHFCCIIYISHVIGLILLLFSWLDCTSSDQLIECQLGGREIIFIFSSFPPQLQITATGYLVYKTSVWFFISWNALTVQTAFMATWSVLFLTHFYTCIFFYIPVFEVFLD